MCLPCLSHQPGQLRWQRTAAKQPTDFHGCHVRPGTTHILLRDTKAHVGHVGTKTTRNPTDFPSNEIIKSIKLLRVVEPVVVFQLFQLPKLPKHLNAAWVAFHRSWQAKVKRQKYVLLSTCQVCRAVCRTVRSVMHSNALCALCAGPNVWVSVSVCSAVLCFGGPRFGPSAMLRSSAPHAAHGCGSAPGTETVALCQGKLLWSRDVCYACCANFPKAS